MLVQFHQSDTEPAATAPAPQLTRCSWAPGWTGGELDMQGTVSLVTAYTQIFKSKQPKEVLNPPKIHMPEHPHGPCGGPVKPRAESAVKPGPQAGEPMSQGGELTVKGGR